MKHPYWKDACRQWFQFLMQASRNRKGLLSSDFIFDFITLIWRKELQNIFGNTASWCFYLVIKLDDTDNDIKENHILNFVSSASSKLQIMALAIFCK